MPIRKSQRIESLLELYIQHPLGASGVALQRKELQMRQYMQNAGKKILREQSYLGADETFCIYPTGAEA